MDALFEPWLQAHEDVEEQCLAELLQRAEPIIRRVVYQPPGWFLG